jgi:hypothetical protein
VCVDCPACPNPAEPTTEPNRPKVDCTCHAVFSYVSQGLFERHKLIVSTQLCMAVLRSRGELQRAKFEVLLRGPRVSGVARRVVVGSWSLGPDWTGHKSDHFSSLPCTEANPHQSLHMYAHPSTPTLQHPHPPKRRQVMGVDNPLSDWVPEGVWGSVQALRELEEYANLPDDLAGSAKRWREWMELERPGGCIWGWGWGGRTHTCSRLCCISATVESSSPA